ncbi:MAG: TerB family tellurite resistance protein [Deltaproteobacteria bacterium]|nr:TerB family tellurite resistance protein [Deltaproteobacteria bacterium]MDQ3300754.1 TerB family tellurite resistance protein [Myxococcota bacterium]
MLGLIFFGTRGVTYGSEGGEFHCPDCEGKEQYRHRKVRRFFTLYFIPLIPLDLLGEYIECQRCTSTYKTSILDFDPKAAEAREEAAFRGAMRRVLVLMMLADGVVEQSEIEAIQSILGKLEDREVPREEIDGEVSRAQIDATDIEHYCRSMAGYLNDSGREMVIKAALLVASADGNFDQSEREALAAIATALNMSRAHFTGVVTEMTRDTPPAAPAAPAGPPN